MSILFGTKAETLASLESILTSVRVLPQFRFTVEQWLRAGMDLFTVERLPDWFAQLLIVRSSSITEDSSLESLAGHFISVPNVHGLSILRESISKVIDSFHGNSPQDQIFIQPMLTDVTISGVAFSRDPNNGAPYFVVNYDDHSGSVDTVTGGSSNDLVTYYQTKYKGDIKSEWLEKVISLLVELETLFAHDALDIEFAIDKNGELYLLQVRPLVIISDASLTVSEHERILTQISNKVQSLSKPHPYLLGYRSVFGIMPDWNPAEIIGVRPRPLALSLYKELVTDNIWAYQRDNYGYKNLRSFPLLISFAGLPYIDVRVSFNSFIPSDVDEELAERLVNYYIDRLIEVPSHHDKVEFEIIYSCYTMDMPKRLQALRQAGFSEQDCDGLAESLRHLTNNIIHSETGLWKKDVAKLEDLQTRLDVILNSELNDVEKIYWLLEDCKRYGTLPFAGLARAGFIAVQLLKSLVVVNVLSEQDYTCFMNSLNTVSSGISKDFQKLSQKTFLEKYGHLRPGTYDILSPRYDEAPDQYFNWKKAASFDDNAKSGDFTLNLKTLNHLEQLLISHQLDHNVLSLFNFIKEAIEGREYAKFVFTRSLSEAMRLFGKLGNRLDFSQDEISYADINIIKQLYASSDSAKLSLKHSIEKGKMAYAATCSINLPPLITDSADVFRFELPRNEPNFITLKSVTASVVSSNKPEHSELAGKILMVSSADPGYDWVFSHDIAGFITMYGGANSHMAIRAGELGIPAVIGAGESLYRQWQTAQVLLLDCANRQVKVLQ